MLVEMVVSLLSKTSVKPRRKLVSRFVQNYQNPRKVIKRLQDVCSLRFRARLTITFTCYTWLKDLEYLLG